MKYGYIAILVSFIISMTIGYQLRDLADKVKEQNRLGAGKYDFLDFDVDKNGTISAEDLNVFFTDNFKKRGDGTLNPWAYDEVLSPITNDKKRQAADNHFKKIDVNNDLTITSDEYVSFNVAQIQNILTQLIKQRQEVKKPSQSGKLKPVEFKRIKNNDAEE